MRVNIEITEKEYNALVLAIDDAENLWEDAKENEASKGGENKADFFEEKIANLKSFESKVSGCHYNEKKDFTQEQLSLIRDLLGDMLDKDIELGHTANAEEDLEIINVIQSLTNCDEYESLDQYRRNISGSWGYVELPKKEDEEDEE